MANFALSPPASPCDWESAIGELLTDLAAVQAELLDVLQQKRSALAAANLARLAELQPRENALAERLEECHARRAGLLAAARREGLAAENVGQLAACIASGNKESRVERVREIGARMRLLQHHSLANWVLAQRSLLHVAQLLEIIATGGRMQPTYGDKDSIHSRGSLVDQDG